MRRRKYELSAWLCVEVGKNWVEADADVAEAIDLLRNQVNNFHLV